jgi:8-oxo-dGTP diphosphatase
MNQVAFAVLVRDGRVLLGRRTPQRQAYPNTWDVIGGHVEPGETIEAALVREVREEVGLTPTSFAAFGTMVEPRPAVNGPATYHIFVVDGWDGGEPVMLGDEHSELRWFTLAEARRLPDLAHPDYPDLFAAILTR